MRLILDTVTFIWAASAPERLSRAAMTALRKATAVRELSELREAYAPFERGIPERLAQLRDMADASYRAGSVNVLVLLDALRAQVEIELESLDTLAALFAADARARSLLGQNIPGNP